MLHYRRHAALLGGSCVLWLSACQVLSGLADLNSDGSAPVAAAGGGGGGGVSGGSSGSLGGGSAGVGGLGVGGLGVGGGPDTFPCDDALVTGVATPVDKLVITPDMTRLVWTSKAANGDADTSIQSYHLTQATLETIVPGPAMPPITGIAADNTYVYWIVGGEKDPASNQTVYRGNMADLDGIHAKATFVQESKAISALAATATAVFWAIPEQGWLRVKSGMSYTQYFASDSPTLGKPMTLLPYQTSLYWRRATAGTLGGPIVYVDGIPPSPNPVNIPASTLIDTMYGVEFFLANDMVYWTEQLPQTGQIRFGSISGGTVTNPMTMVPNIPPPTHIIVGNNNLFWAQGPTPACSDVVMRTLVGSGNALIPLAKGGPCVSNFVQDGTYVYWGSGTTICRALR